MSLLSLGSFRDSHPRVLSQLHARLQALIPAFLTPQSGMPSQSVAMLLCLQTTPIPHSCIVAAFNHVRRVKEGYAQLALLQRRAQDLKQQGLAGTLSTFVQKVK
jgi:hypothetical protein